MRWRVGERAHPFTVAGALIAVEMLAMGFMGDFAIVRSALLLGNTPGTVMVLAGLTLGAATSWAGWHAGKKPAATVGLAAQAA